MYLYLKGRSDAAGICWPGIGTAARELHLSPSTVKRAIRDLERGGYLSRQARFRPNGSHTSNLYILRQ